MALNIYADEGVVRGLQTPTQGQTSAAKTATLLTSKNFIRPAQQSAVLEKPITAAAEVAIPIPFVDDGENGVQGWTATGFWNLISNPEDTLVDEYIRQQLVRFPDEGQLPACVNGNACWWFGEAVTGTYANDYFFSGNSNGAESDCDEDCDITGTLTSPLIDLSGAQNATSSFKTFWEIQASDQFGDLS